MKPSAIVDASGPRVRTNTSLKFSGQGPATEAAATVIETSADLSSHGLALSDKILTASEYNLSQGWHFIQFHVTWLIDSFYYAIC